MSNVYFRFILACIIISSSIPAYSEAWLSKKANGFESKAEPTQEQPSLESSSLSSLEESSLEEKPKKKRKKRKSRKLSSIEENGISIESKNNKRTQTSQSKIGLFPGFAGVQTGGGATLLNLGLQADFRFPYWGIEADTYFGLGLGLDSLATASTYTQYGAALAIKTNYEVSLGSSKFIPKIGLGYGQFGMSSTVASVSNSLSYGGGFVLAGFDYQITRWLNVYLDYATSVFASGSLSGDAATGTTADGITFSRLRGGLQFLVGENFIIGGQYYLRNVGIQGTSATAQTFILGNIGVQW